MIVIAIPAFGAATAALKFVDFVPAGAIFAAVSDNPADNVIFPAVLASKAANSSVVIASDIVIVNTSVPAVDSALCVSWSPLIVAVTVPVVAAAILFICVTWSPVIVVIAGVIITLTSASLSLIAVRLACTVFTPVPIYVANAPVNPAAEKSTVAAFVASIIALPCVTVATSSTTIVNAQVAFVPLAAKSSNCATLPSILAVTVPAVNAAILFTCVTWSAVISSKAGVIVIFTLASLFLIAVRLACTVFAPSAI